MKGIHIRGFDYPLEPVRQRREWKLDAALVRLVAVRRQLAECQALQSALEQESQTQALQAGRMWKQRADPSSHSRLLTYLARLHGRRQQLECERADLDVKLKKCRDESVRCHQDLEALQRHRVDAWSEHRLQQERKASTQADDDWTARATPRQEQK